MKIRRGANYSLTSLLALKIGSSTSSRIHGSISEMRITSKRTAMRKCIGMKSKPKSQIRVFYYAPSANFELLTDVGAASTPF